MSVIGGARLLLITDDSCSREEVTATVRRALDIASQLSPRNDASCIIVMARAPSTPDRELLHLAHSLREVTRAAHARLVISRRVDIALATGADGVHLPERALRSHDARALLGERALIGVSRHQATLDAPCPGADYATVAPVFEVPQKGPALGVDGLRAAVASSPVPLFALGGIDPTRAASVLRAGVYGIAIQRAAHDPAQVEALLQLLANA